MPKRMIWIIAVALVVLLLAGCALKFSTYTVKGYVRNALGEGVNGVRISVSSPYGYECATTTKDGYWSVSGIYGKTVITPKASGWTFKPSVKVIDVNSDVNINFTACPYEYFVSGYVRDEHGKPLSGVTITFEGSNLNATPVKDDLQGFWKSGNLHGSVVVKAEKNGWLFLPSNGIDVSGLSTNVNFVGKKGAGETMYIPIGGVPQGLAVDEAHGKLFVADSSTDLVFVYNVYGYNKIGEYQVGPNPAGLCYDSKDNRLFVANAGTNTITVLNASDGKLIKNILIGGTPKAIAFNAAKDTVYVTNAYYNAVNVLSASPVGISASVRVGEDPEGIAINEKTNMVYVTNAKSDTVSVISALDNSLVDEIKVESYPCGVAVNTMTNKVYVVNRTSGTISVIDGDTDEILKTLKVGGSPSRIWIDENKNLVYVTNTSENSLIVINGETDKVVQTVTVGKGPDWISGSESNGTVYVSNAVEKTVSVVQ